MKTSHVVSVVSSLFLSLSMVLLLVFLFIGPVSIWAAPTASIIRATVTGTTTWPCGSTWGSPCTLQTALSHAASGDEIWVAQGIYTPTLGITRSATFQMVPGVSIYGGFAMTETTRDQRNWTTQVVTLSGDLLGNDGANFTNYDDNSYHVIRGANNATLDGVTVAHGYASTVGATLGMGGGMVNQDVSGLMVSNAIFRDNYAVSSGGGLEISFGSGTISNVLILNNVSQNGGGMDATYATFNLVKISFIGNAAEWGGGLEIAGDTPVNLSNVTFSGNSAPLGGGIDTVDGTGGVTTLNHVTFSGNAGRAISNADRHYFRIYHSVLWGDSGGTEIYSNIQTAVVISNSVVQGGYYGGGTNVITDADSRLGSLGYYGGDTPVLPLLPGSSAIDGDTTTCPATDQRGVTRGTVCDLGAYEARLITMTYASGSGQATPINLAFGQPLVLNISSLYGDPVDGGVVTFVGPVTGAGTKPITNTGTISGGAVSRSLSANAMLGTYTVTADALGTTSGPFAFTLTNLKGNTALTVTATPNPSILGQTATFTASVTSPSGKPTGSITFTIDSTTITVPLNVYGRAIYVTDTLALGNHPVAASYSGDTNFNPSNGTLSGGQTVYEVPVSGLSATNSGPTLLTSATFFTATLTTGSNAVYQWNFGDGTPPAVDAGATTMHTYASAGTYTASVTATNGAGSLTALTLVYVTTNPIAQAGINQTVRTSRLVTLNGSASFDPGDFLPLIYHWQQTGGPAVTLTRPDNVTTTFTSPAITRTQVLTFELLVTNSQSLISLPDEVVITVEPYRLMLPLVLR